MTTPIMPTYARLPVHFSHGEGAWLVDEELDLGDDPYVSGG